jgi:hypothetical protein
MGHIGVEAAINSWPFDGENVHYRLQIMTIGSTEGENPREIPQRRFVSLDVSGAPYPSGEGRLTGGGG